MTQVLLWNIFAMGSKRSTPVNFSRVEKKRIRSSSHYIMYVTVRSSRVIRYIVYLLAVFQILKQPKKTKLGIA